MPQAVTYYQMSASEYKNRRSRRGLVSGPLGSRRSIRTGIRCPRLAENDQHNRLIISCRVRNDAVKQSVLSRIIMAFKNFFPSAAVANRVLYSLAPKRLINRPFASRAFSSATARAYPAIQTIFTDRSYARKLPNRHDYTLPATDEGFPSHRSLCMISLLHS